MKRRSARRFRPALDVMEPRLVMSTMGVNLKGQPNWWADNVWVDIRHSLGAWQNLSNPSTLVTNLTPKGYPLSPAITTVILQGISNGVFPVSYSGKATLEFSGAAKLSTPFTLGADGLYHGAITVDTTATKQLFVTASGQDPSNPFGDLRIIQPGYGTAPTQDFTDAYLKTLQPFSYLRFVEMDGGTNSTLSTWAGRVQPDAFLNTTVNGIPYELMIELCNLTHKDMWINVPAMATDDYIANLASLLKSQLDPSLNVYVEYSNETWNTAFSEYNQVLAASKSNPLVTQGNSTLAVAQQSAFMVKKIGDAFRSAFGADAARVKPVLAGFYTVTEYNETMLSFLKANYGDPSKYIVGLAVAPYVTVSPGDSPTGMSPDAYIASIYNSMDSYVIPILAKNASIAASYNLPLMSYEAGFNGYFSGSTATALFNTVETDPRMYDVMKKLLQAWSSQTSMPLTYYGVSGDFWGLKEYVNDPGSHRWDAAMSYILPPGDADYDGTVTTADLAIVKANMGRQGAWWSQGDFNHDGIVNADDLAIVSAALGVSMPFRFLGNNVATSGNWQGTYGGDGYVIPGGPSSVPSYASVTTSNALQYVWSTNTSDSRALASTGSTSGTRMASTWYNPTTFSIDVKITDGQSHAVSLYFLDWDNNGRAEKVQAVDPATGATLDLRSVSAYGGGSYLTWNVSGAVRFIVTRTAGVNATVSGVLFGYNPPQPAAATRTLTDTLNQGNWKAIYGTEGYLIPNGGSSLPAYASVSVTGGSPLTWASSTSDVRALTAANTTVGARLASAWSGSKLTFDVNIKDGKTHALSLYFLDWDTKARWQQIQVTDARTGAVLDTASVSAFNGGAYLSWNVSGPVRIVVSRSTGTSAVVSGLFFGINAPPASSASLVSTNSTAQGNWQGVVGRDGYVLANGPASIPSYATVTTTGSFIYTYASNTADPRGLSVPGSTTNARLAATWYSPTTFSINVNITDGQTHAISLYGVDWDANGRAEQIQVVDGYTGAVLDTQSLSSFYGGKYLTWNVSGAVRFVVSRRAGANGVVNAVFFGSNADKPATASFTSTNTTVQGNWQGNYGADGYVIPGGSSSVPAYAKVTPLNSSVYAWATSTTDVRALSVPGTTTSSRMASSWYSPTSFGLDVTITDGESHPVSLYLLDWDSQGRAEQIQVIDATTGTILDTRTAASFSGGSYLTWNVSGHVRFMITCTAGIDGVVGGLFFDAAVRDAATASFSSSNTTVQGNWQGNYGDNGYSIPGGSTSLPSYATVSPFNALLYTWASSTTDTRALTNPGSTTGTRMASTWYNIGTFGLDVKITDGKSHPVSLYLLDWDSRGRAEQIQVIDATTGTVLDTRSASSFKGGTYMTWNISGHVNFLITATAGGNGVVGGIFFDGLIRTTATASFTSTNTTVQGNWQGNYGADGYVIPAGTTSLPSYATVTPQSTYLYTWASSTTDTRALTVPGSTTGRRMASTWYSPTSFALDVNITDGQSHSVSLYLLDWDANGRAEQIQVVDVATGNILDSRTASSFKGGTYLTWNVSGHVRFVITRTSGVNSVVGGIFFG
ncbi:dockerin type I domain-containing protein [Aquisphaera insulae]|uniref:dockerin type I domain-containing protein n=1 Tax=Aquisphaera insulae TaxID=2712864 RepID=UPI0013E9D34D|nr:dockerin type I domain-containing protein [Aquisphaera insulae]